LGRSVLMRKLPKKKFPKGGAKRPEQTKFVKLRSHLRPCISTNYTFAPISTKQKHLKTMKI